MSDQPISETQRSKELPGGCLIAFGSIFFLAGLIMFWFLLYLPLLTFQASRSWPSTECEILTGKLREIDGDDGSTWRAEFTYAYEVDGQRYVGDRDRISTLSGSRKSARQRLEQFPVGKRFPCWYDPDDPASSLLDRDVSWADMIFAIVLPGIFTCVGGGIMLFGFVLMRKNRPIKREGRPRSGSESDDVFHASPIRRDSDAFDHEAVTLLSLRRPARADDSGLLPADIKDREADRPQRLKPESSRWLRLLGLVFICCFWNGIVGVFVWVLFVDPPFGMVWGQIGLGLFLLPFIGVGLAIAAGVVHSAISIFNPTVSVAISSGAIPRGGTVDVAWEISGGLRRIHNLNVSVVGTEWARYIVGTDTRTEESVFEVMTACQTTHADTISFGSATIEIPAGTMHSFDEDNNQINWAVRVHGAIPWWPDVSEAFPFRVTPGVVGSDTLLAGESDNV